MQRMLFNYFAATVFLGIQLLIVKGSFAQTICSMSGSTTLSTPFLPTTGTNKALIIFVKFSDDIFGSTATGSALCTTDPETEWPYDRSTIPEWANDIIDPTDVGSHTVGSLTDYFCKMSRDRTDGAHGKFHLVGHVYPNLIVPDHVRSWYQNLSNHGFANEWIAVNREILQKVKNDPQGLSLSIYDDYQNGTATRTPDGVFDMIFIVFRTHFNTGFSGNSRLDGLSSTTTSTSFGSFDLGGDSIDGSFATGSGIIATGYDQIGVIELLAHEYCHRIFGGGHLDYIGRYGVMDGVHESGAMSAYERERAGWISPMVIASDQANLQIKESVTNADVYKILLPEGEYLLLENRQNVFWTDTYWGDGGDPCDKVRLPGTGLMVAHIDPPSPSSNSLSSSELYWKRANGGPPVSITFGDDTDPYKPGNQIQLSPWTTPNSNTRSGSLSGVAISNIRLSGNDVIVDICLSFDSGTIYENSTWNGSISLTGDIDVVSGRILAVNANTSASFPINAKLTINGTLTANGTSSQPVTFTRSGTSGTWDGIQFNSGSSGTLQYANISYTTKGVYVNGTNNVTIDNCTIEHFSEQGVYASNSSLTVKNSTIQNDDGASHGIYLAGGSSNPTIQDNTIKDASIGIERLDSPGAAQIFGNTIKNCATGMQTTNSSPEIFNNYISLNIRGVRLGTGSAPDIHDNDIFDNSEGIELDQSQPSNVKWNNFGWSGGVFQEQGDEGILVNYLTSSNAFLDYKWNNFYDGNVVKDISNPTNVTLYARGNYWYAGTVVGPADVSSPQSTANANAGPGGTTGKFATAPGLVASSALSVLPDRFVLQPNYPNPFNPETTIRFQLPEKARVTLSL